MRIFSDFSELKAAIGTEIGVSEWVEITQDRINRFAEASCDEQWMGHALLGNRSCADQSVLRLKKYL